MRIMLIAVLNLGSVALHAQWSNTNPVYFNSGNVGIGTETPGIWFGTKTFEFSDTRPVFKLSSTSPTGLSTIVFTNNGVNNITHLGEFHTNYHFNAANNALSFLNFSSYPVQDILTLQSNGRVGIGTTSPRSPLEIQLIGDNNSVQTGLIIQQINPGAPNNTSGISLDFGIGNNGVHRNIQGKITVRETYSSVRPKMIFSLWDVNNTMQDRMVIDTQGNVGIGSVSPDARLTVKGTIHTEEVLVDMGVPGPDYVFEKDYNLLPLNELEAYINQNKHLPEVPSAKEMEANGLKLMEMNMLLLKKVEELTLHMIQLKKDQAAQEKEMKAKIADLKKQLKNK